MVYYYRICCAAFDMGFRQEQPTNQEQGHPVAGVFEVIRDNDGPLPFRFLLRGGDGAVIAVSPGLESITAVKEGITAVRESAAGGSIVDLT
jgi:uncharacterized protein YegP (UPF0339 family)